MTDVEGKLYEDCLQAVAGVASVPSDLRQKPSEQLILLWKDNSMPRFRISMENYVSFASLLRIHKICITLIPTRPLWGLNNRQILAFGEFRWNFSVIYPTPSIAWRFVFKNRSHLKSLSSFLAWFHIMVKLSLNPPKICSRSFRVRKKVKPRIFWKDSSSLRRLGLNKNSETNHTWPTKLRSPWMNLAWWFGMKQVVLLNWTIFSYFFNQG